MNSFSDFVIYADESGDHSLVKVDPNYPVFVLTLCLFRKDEYMRRIVPSFQALKFRYFGHDAIIFHEREIRKQEPPFDILLDRTIRESFVADLGDVVRKARFNIVAAVIDKRRLNEDLFPDNPYALAVGLCLEKAYRFLESQKQADRMTHCIFERRGKKEDDTLELAFLRIVSGENSFRRPLRNFSIRFVDKKANSSGMQIADLTARPIGLSVMRPRQRNQAMTTIRRKICRMPDDARGSSGIRIFP